MEIENPEETVEEDIDKDSQERSAEIQNLVYQKNGAAKADQKKTRNLGKKLAINKVSHGIKKNKIILPKNKLYESVPFDKIVQGNLTFVGSNL